MKSLNSITSACKYCQYYRPEGRRGGLCQQLGVPVRGSWKACSLAASAFTPAWKKLEGLMVWPPEEALTLQEQTLDSDCGLEVSPEKVEFNYNKLNAHT